MKFINFTSSRVMDKDRFIIFFVIFICSKKVDECSQYLDLVYFLL